jgi:rhamnulokinase
VSTFAAVDLGASSGRVITAEVGPERLELTGVHRFPNNPVRVADTLHWDILALYQGVLDGLRAAAARGPLAGIGIDSWAVDYGLLDRRGALIGNPVHYRDDRTSSTVDLVYGKIPASELYAATGIQYQPFNTIFQLAAEGDRLDTADAALLLPDLLAYWLTGSRGTELTNASTTAMIDPRTRDWSAQVMDSVGLDPELFPPLRQPGESAGELRPAVCAELGLAEPVPVFAVGSHDTASAVAGVPADGGNFAYISSGTWSLVGVELDEPVLTEESRQANFTNELGVDGTIRYLRNVMGLWLLQECRREWGIDDVSDLLTQAADVTPMRGVVDATDPRFLPPGAMSGRIIDACRETGQPEPDSPAEITRCVLDSLAVAYRTAIADAQRLSGERTDVVHVVGGGIHNELLCQLTADACGLPVVTGPAEATALGNVLVQARAAGALDGTLDDLRALARGTQPLRRYDPGGRTR